jgi:hypothetical protein
LFIQRLRSRLDGVGAALQTAKRRVGRAAAAMEVDRATVGDIGFKLADVDLAMSHVSSRVLRRLDFEAIRRQRVRNFRDLAERLDGRVSALRHEAADGVCPLFFPLLVPDKRAAASRLRECGIEALEFWNEGADTLESEASPETRFLRAHVLGLPVHQDLTPKHIAYIAQQIGRLDLRIAS